MDAVALQPRQAAEEIRRLHTRGPDHQFGLDHAAVGAAFDGLPAPMEAVLLGMGEDAHTASLFPGAPGYARAIATDQRLAWVVPEQAPIPAPHARISFTLSALLAARELMLSIAGESKLVVYRQAALARDEALPISLVLHQTQTPVSVWIG